jgi:hypothetical protein
MEEMGVPVFVLVWLGIIVAGASCWTAIEYVMIAGQNRLGTGGSISAGSPSYGLYRWRSSDA